MANQISDCLLHLLLCTHHICTQNWCYGQILGHLFSMFAFVMWYFYIIELTCLICDWKLEFWKLGSVVAGRL